MNNNKKGISAIVATVLIILITVAAVTIIWAAIIPMISNQLESGTVCLDAVSQVTLKDSGYTCYDATNNQVSIQVARGAKDFNLVDIQVLTSSGGSTTSYKVMTNANPTPANILNPNEEQVYKFDVPAGVVVEEVQIAPIVGVGSQQDSCEVSATRTLEAC